MMSSSMFAVRVRVKLGKGLGLGYLTSEDLAYDWFIHSDAAC